VLGSVSSNFSDIVTIGERIEHRLKNGKIAQGSSAATNDRKLEFNNNNNKKKEGEVQAASVMPYWGRYQHQYRPNYRPSSAYVANVVPSYPPNAPRPSAAYRPPFAPNNVYQSNTGGQNSNQSQNQGYGQRNNQGERMVKFTPIHKAFA